MSMETTLIMKQLSIVLILSWSSVISGNAVGHVSPINSDVQLKSDGNIVEMYKGSVNGSSWLQMVLVFARDSANNQPQLHIEDAPCSSSDEATIKCPEVTTEAPKVCKEGFVQLESKKCYFFSNKTEKWQDALKACQSLNTTLAYPVNANENTVLVNHVKKNFEAVDSWWFGGTDELVQEGEWVWAHDKSPIGYTDWLAKQPDNTGSAEHCLHIHKSHGWKWNDVPCHNIYNYICQQ